MAWLGLALPASIMLTALGWRRRFASSWADAVLAGFAVTGLLTVVATEILNCFHAIEAVPIAFFWGGSLLALVFWGRHSLACHGAPGFRLCLETRTEKAAAFLLVVLVGATAFVAVSYPPNTWDSMTYHMPRVIHWANSGSVDFYPTNTVRQNLYLPGGEYVLLHLYLLTGTDRWLGLVQWLAMLGVLTAVWSISGMLGADRRGQMVAVFFTGTLPIFLLEATGTQNDLLMTLWVAVGIQAMLRLRSRPSGPVLMLLALATGLAAVTKGMFFILLPFLAVMWSRWDRSWRVRSVVAALAAVIVISGPFYMRLQSAWRLGVPLPDGGMVMQRLDPPAVASNVVRHAASQTLTVSNRVNGWVREAVLRMHQRLGIDPQDPRTTNGWIDELGIKAFAFHEDYAGALWHIFWLAAAFMTARAVWSCGPAADYVAALAAAGMIFLIFAKWQPWVTRFHMVFLVLAAPLAGLAARRIGGLAGRKVRLFMAGAGGLAVMTVVLTPCRPLLGVHGPLAYAEGRYFINRPYLLNPYMRLSELITRTGCQEVGLAFLEDDWEYPLWVLNPGVRFRHVEAQARGWPASLAETLESGSSYGPRLILANRKKWKDPLEFRTFGQYALVWTNSLYGIYEKRKN